MEEHIEEYEIKLFCPVDNEWEWAYDEGYHNEAGDGAYYNMEDALLGFNDICNKIKKERYPKVQLVKNNNKIVDNKVETLSTEIIREFEQKIEMVTLDGCYCCGGGAGDSYCNPNDPQQKLNIEKGLKKYVSPCNGIKISKECICGECETLWFCEDCVDAEGKAEMEPNIVYFIDNDDGLGGNQCIDDSWNDDGLGLTLKKIKKIKQEEQEAEEYREQAGGVVWNGE